MPDRDGHLRPDSTELRLDALLDTADLRRPSGAQPDYHPHGEPNIAPRDYRPAIAEFNVRMVFWRKPKNANPATGSRALDVLLAKLDQLGCDVHVTESSSSATAWVMYRQDRAPRRLCSLFVPLGDLEAGVEPLVDLLEWVARENGRACAEYEAAMEAEASR